MKTRFLALALALAVSPTDALGQGTLNFANIGVGLNAPVTNWDGTPLAGSAFVVDLYWAPGIVTDSTLLMALGAPAVFWTNGYFLGGQRTIPSSPAGTIITVQVRAGDSAGCPFVWTFAQCSWPFQHGESALFQVTLTSPPYPPVSFLGLEPFGISPPTTALPPRFTLNSVIGNRLVLSWPPSLAGTQFVLQQNTDLNTTNWVTISETPVFTGPQFSIAIPKPVGTMFYRLVSK